MSYLKDALKKAANIDLFNSENGLKIGDETNNTEFNADGTQRLKGTATAWRDMIGDLFGKRLSSTSGKIDYDYDNNALKFQSGGSISDEADRVGANLEINHDLKVGSSITFKPHIHWFQDWASDSVTAFELTMRYRLQKNNEAMTTAWTSETLTAGVNDLYDFTGEGDDTYNQLSTFPDITLDCNLSDTLQIQLARTDTEIGDMLVYFIDVHAEVDSFGSDSEYVKS
jgi:hypothetical protein